MDTEKNTDFLKEFGKRVRELRLKRKMTQEELSVHLEVTVVSISHIERGVHPPAFNKLWMLASALDIEVWELFVDPPKRSADIIPL